MKPHPHLPLRALLQQAQTEEAIWLPDVLTMPVPRRWAWLSWLLLGWVPWLMVALELTPVLGLGGVLVLGLLGWVLCTCWGWRRWVVGSSAVAQEDMPLEWDGWRVQFAQRAVWRQGAALPWQPPVPVPLMLEPADLWSVGVLPGTSRDRSEPYIWWLELRHQSRGPVAHLCTVTSWTGVRAVREDIDALVDTLAQRLGIRRSGSRLQPLPRSASTLKRRQ